MVNYWICKCVAGQKVPLQSGEARDGSHENHLYVRREYVFWR